MFNFETIATIEDEKRIMNLDPLEFRHESDFILQWMPKFIESKKN